MLTRRRFVSAGATAAALALSPWKTLERALAAAPTQSCAALDGIEHVVFLINENRSFDSYFGTYRGVRGFADGRNRKAFAQPFPGSAGKPYGGHLLPFHFDTTKQGECVNDIDHSWGAQHLAWHNGANDAFLKVHLQTNGLRDGPNTMGYYARDDLPFFHALADQARGISWKVYGGPDANYGDNVLPYFKAYQQNPALLANALTPTIPGTFETDCAAGTLPQVSWILAPLIESEHPPAPVTYGEVAAATALDALVSNPGLWAKAALFITYDENGGFFDHVPSPVPPKGTPGEFLTVSPLPADAAGIAGPIGLGFRVPLLVVSPFARGGFVCSDTFDHTSLLCFLETRFGAEVPNLTAWRRSVTGDLTRAFDFARPDASVPALPNPSLADRRVLLSDCPTNAPDTGDESFPSVTGYPLPPPPQTMPGQEPGKPLRPSGLIC